METSWSSCRRLPAVEPAEVNGSGKMIEPKSLTDEERAVYEWQMWVPEFGEVGQEKLKGASVLISRIGGLGGVVAYELAAAGVGRLVLAHAGDVKPSDLNRQLLINNDAPVSNTHQKLPTTPYV